MSAPESVAVSDPALVFQLVAQSAEAMEVVSAEATEVELAEATEVVSAASLGLLLLVPLTRVPEVSQTRLPVRKPVKEALPTMLAAPTRKSSGTARPTETPKASA